MSVWAWADIYAGEHALPVGPLDRVSKQPLTPHGFKDFSTHPEQIATFAAQFPKANLGGWPGPAGFIVVDVDGPAGESIARDLGVLSDSTPEVVTRRGVHRWFRLPKGRIVGNVALEQLDIRAHAGYVVLPPSVHESGHVYTWRGHLDDAAPVPVSLLAMLDERATRKPAPARSTYEPPRLLTALDPFSQRRVEAYTDRVGYGLVDGRKNAAYRLAAFYRFDVGLASDLAFRCLHVWNGLNAPPLDDDTLATIFKNAERYARGCA